MYDLTHGLATVDASQVQVKRCPSKGLQIIHFMFIIPSIHGSVLKVP